MILAIFDLQVAPMPPTYFQVSRKRSENINFQDVGHRDHLEFLIGMILAVFDLRHSDATNQVSSPLAFRFRSRSEK